jgi:hypothetical protein
VTLYKWWPSKGALALEAYLHAVEQYLEFPDTGDIEADLIAQVRSFIGLLAGRSGSVMRELWGSSAPVLAETSLSSLHPPRS